MDQQTPPHEEDDCIEQAHQQSNSRPNRGTVEIDAIGNTTVDVSQNNDVVLPRVLWRMPNTAFGIPMGIAGHAIMWNTLRHSSFFGKVTVEVIDILNLICWFASLSISIFIAMCYIYKICTSFPLVLTEYLNEVRCHFFNAPNLIFIMLLISLPDYMNVPKQKYYGHQHLYQVVMTSHIYKAWMFSKRRNFTEAKPQFLLSTVGWFLLAVLGQKCDIRDEWGIGLPAMCFGAGFMLYIDIVIFIFGKLHENTGMKGSPAMFLLIAPPSVGVVALDMLNNGASDFSQAGEMLLGWVFVLFLLLIRLGPILSKNPSVFGEYWAYVFPLAAATTATVRYASALNTAATEVLAMVMVALAIVSIFLVSGRMSYHMYRCFQGLDHWNDPLFDLEKYATRRFR